MNLKKKFGNIFINLLISNNDINRLFLKLEYLYNKKVLSKDLFLCFIKCIIIILSYNKEKINLIILFIDKLLICSDKIKENLLCYLKKIDINNLFNISDKIIERIIINTFKFFEYFIYLESSFLFDIWYNILFNIFNIKCFDFHLKLNVYLLLLFEIKNFIIKNKNNISIVKIKNFCSKFCKLINDFNN